MTHHPQRSFLSDAGIFAVRLAFGAGIAFHGLDKLAHPLDWMNLAHLPWTAPPILQAAAAAAEGIGGWGLAIGLLTPFWAFLLVCDMSVAIATVHLPAHQQFIARHGGGSYELAGLYLAAAFLLLTTGPGRWSIDFIFGARSRSRQNAADRAAVEASAEREHVPYWYRLYRR
jgi:putative oxidoreductase